MGGRLGARPAQGAPRRTSSGCPPGWDGETAVAGRDRRVMAMAVGLVGAGPCVCPGPGPGWPIGERAGDWTDRAMAVRADPSGWRAVETAPISTKPAYAGWDGVCAVNQSAQADFVMLGAVLTARYDDWFTSLAFAPPARPRPSPPVPPQRGEFAGDVHRWTGRASPRPGKGPHSRCLSRRGALRTGRGGVRRTG